MGVISGPSDVQYQLSQTTEELAMEELATANEKQVQKIWAIRRLLSQARYDKLRPAQLASLQAAKDWLEAAQERLYASNNLRYTPVSLPEFPLSQQELDALREAIRRNPARSSLKGKAKRRSKRTATIIYSPDAHFRSVTRKLWFAPWPLIFVFALMGAGNALAQFYFTDVPRDYVIYGNLAGIVLAIAVCALTHFTILRHAVTELNTHLAVHHSDIDL